LHGLAPIGATVGTPRETRGVGTPREARAWSGYATRDYAHLYLSDPMEWHGDAGDAHSQDADPAR
jgi:hypothetical protein